METLELVPVETDAPAKPAAVSKATTDLTKIDLKAVALSRFGDWRPAAAALVEKYKGVAFDTMTTKGYEEATKARAEVRAPRYAAQNVSKASKSELAQVSKAIGAEEQAIIAALADTEEAIDAQIRAADERKAREKAEREQRERDRKRAHEERLAALRGYVAQAQGLPAARIANGIVAVEAILINPADWEEYAEQATQAKEETLASLRALLARTQAAEAEAAERERQRAEQARIAEEQRAEAARLKAAADELAMKQREAEAELKRQQAEFERQRAEWLAAQEAAKAPPAPEPQAEPETPASEPTTATAEADLAAGPDMHAEVEVATPPAAIEQPSLAAPLRTVVHKSRPLPEDQRLIDAAELARKFGAEEMGGIWTFYATSDIADLIDAARAA
jgi:hypothetical protein